MAPLAPLVAMRRSTSESVRELPAGEVEQVRGHMRMALHIDASRFFASRALRNGHVERGLVTLLALIAPPSSQSPPSQLGSLATAPPLMRNKPLAQESASMPRSNRMAEMRALSGSLPEKVQEKEPLACLSALRLPPGRLAADPVAPLGKGELLAALPMKLPARLQELPLQPLGGASKSSLLPSRLQETLGTTNAKQLPENSLNMTMRPGKLLPSASMPAPKASSDLSNPPLGRPSLRSLSAVGNDNTQMAPSSPRPKKLIDEIGHCREALSEEGGAVGLPLRPACSLPSILPAPPVGPARTNNPRTSKYRSLRSDILSTKVSEAVVVA
jgi:hypothetical protein